MKIYLGRILSSNGYARRNTANSVEQKTGAGEMAECWSWMQKAPVAVAEANAAGLIDLKEIQPGDSCNSGTHPLLY